MAGLIEQRLARLARVYHADPDAVVQASWSIQWALQLPGLDPDTAARASRLRAHHPLDDAGMRDAVELALVRCGTGRDDARRLGDLGLETLMALAAAAPEPEA